MTKNYLAVPTREQMVNLFNDIRKLDNVFDLNIESKETKSIPSNLFSEWRIAIDDCNCIEDVAVVVMNCPQDIKKTNAFGDVVGSRLKYLGVI